MSVTAGPPRLPDDATVRAVAGAFGVLADPARLRIVLVLLDAGELCVGDIAAAAGVSETSTSQHLRVLRSTDAVRRRQVGRSVFYALADGHVRTLLEVALAHVRHAPP